MKVAILTTSFPRYSGDYAGSFVFDFARSLVDEGFEVQVLAPHDTGCKTNDMLAGVKIHRFRYFWPATMQVVAYGAGIPRNIRSSWMARLELFPFVLSFLWSSLQVIRKCDIVHAHWIEPAAIAWLAQRVTGTRPFVVSLHRYDLPERTGRLVSRTVLAKADSVLFNSLYTRARCLRDLEIGSEHVIPPAVDTTRFRSKWERGNSRSSGDMSRQLKVFALGSLIPRKGFINLVEAIPKVLAHTDCQFVIGGDGPERGRILERANQLGVAQHIDFLGQVSTADVPRLMREADVFVLPSVPESSGYDETLGVVLLEALASGTPCIASRTGGIPDALENEEDGYLVAPGDSAELASQILRLAADDDLREKMGRSGRRKVEQRFSLQYAARRTMMVYEDILQRHRNARRSRA